LSGPSLFGDTITKVSFRSSNIYIYIYISIDVKEKRRKRWPSGTPAREECNEYDLTAAPYF